MKSLLQSLIFCLTLATTVAADPNAALTPPTIAEIRLSAEQQRGLEARRDKAVTVSSAHASTFKIVPGLKNPGLVSLEAVGLEGCYLRHQKFVLYLHRQPKPTSVLFEADATFKLVAVGGNKVRFEASNYAGMFLTARNDGSVIMQRNAPLEESTFFLRPATE